MHSVDQRENTRLDAKILKAHLSRLSDRKLSQWAKLIKDEKRRREEGAAK